MITAYEEARREQDAKNNEEATYEASVCIVDFCGSCAGLPCSFWADWWTDAKVVTFGGDWYEVPDMPSAEEPTQEAVSEWAHANGGI